MIAKLTPFLACFALVAIAPVASAQRGGKKPIDKIFERLDTNKDGKITQEEAGERWARISKADANEDGAVTKDELAASMKNRKRRQK
ncbi:MAG: EF-hand domain-containing protein [Planctomycetes bacterium]|nr:EF-hand domain-containing protein [Planctomycetota bacterium]